MTFTMTTNEYKQENIGEVPYDKLVQEYTLALELGRANELRANDKYQEGEVQVALEYAGIVGSLNLMLGILVRELDRRDAEEKEEEDDVDDADVEDMLKALFGIS